MTETQHAQLLLAIMRQDWDNAQALVRDGSLEPALFLELCRQTTIPSYLHVLLTNADRWSLVGKEVADRNDLDERERSGDRGSSSQLRRW